MSDGETITNETTGDDRCSRTVKWAVVVVIATAFLLGGWFYFDSRRPGPMDQVNDMARMLTDGVVLVTRLREHKDISPEVFAESKIRFEKCDDIIARAEARAARGYDVEDQKREFRDEFLGTLSGASVNPSAINDRSGMLASKE